MKIERIKKKNEYRKALEDIKRLEANKSNNENKYYENLLAAIEQYEKRKKYLFHRAFLLFAVLFFIVLGCVCLKHCIHKQSHNEQYVNGQKDKDETNDEQKQPEPEKDLNSFLETFEKELTSFDYVMKMEPKVRSALLNNKKIPLADLKSLESKANGYKYRKLNTMQIANANEVVINTEFLSCMLKNVLSDEWYLDWSFAANTFRPLTIRLSQAHTATTLKRTLIEDVMPRCTNDSGSILYQNATKEDVTNEDIKKLSKKLLQHFCDQNNKINNKDKPVNDTPNSIDNKTKSNYSNCKIDMDFQQSLAFFTSFSKEQKVFNIYYAENNLYGDLIKRKKIGWHEDSNVAVMPKDELVDRMLEVLEINSKLITLNNGSLSSVVAKSMKEREGKSGRLSNSDRKIIINNISGKFFDLLKK